MAAALLKELTRGAVIVRSSGSMPDESLDANVLQARREIGLDPGRTGILELTA